MISIADIEHAMVRYLKTFEEYKDENVGPEKFSDGWAFATILRAATNFKISYGDLIESSEKWTFKLSNLKKIMALVEQYFQDRIGKSIKTKDIDLIEISKNNNIEELAKMFEVVVAVMTEAANKEDHINVIMSLDERSQSTFVYVIQNVIENRVSERLDPKKENMVMMVSELQNENMLIKQEVEQILQQNFALEKELEVGRSKEKEYEDELEELRGDKINRQMPTEEQFKEKDYLKNMIDNLKDKLLCTVREHEIKVAGMKEENDILEHKVMRFEEMEEELEEYKRKYAETIDSYGKLKLWEKQKGKMSRLLEEKDEIIRKLNQKLEEANEMNYSMQEKELYAKMELEKRDVRFKELEKEVKKRYENLNPVSLIDNSNASSLDNMAKLTSYEQEELEQVREELEKSKMKLREMERENSRLKRAMEKISNMETEKKKLERLILDVNNQKKEQVEMLLSTTYDFYSENLRLKDLLDRNKVIS